MESVYLAPEPALEGNDLEASLIYLEEKINEAFEKSDETFTHDIFPHGAAADAFSALCVVDNRLKSIRELYSDVMEEEDVAADQLIQLAETLKAIDSILPQLRLIYDNVVELCLELGSNSELFDALEKMCIGRATARGALEKIENELHGQHAISAEGSETAVQLSLHLPDL